MAHVSILLPAFYIKETNENEIKNFCSSQFEKDPSEFDLKLINSDTMEYAIRFHQSNLSLTAIEEMVYQRDCMRSLVEKTFESLQSMMEKLVLLEKEFCIVPNKSNEFEQDDSLNNTNIIADNQKLRNLLSFQLENSEKFKQNTERTLNRIKEEFQSIVLELESLRKKTTKHKSVNSLDFHESNKGDKSLRSSNPMSSRESNNVPKLKLGNKK